MNPPYEYLITLNDTLTQRDVLREGELQALFAGLSPKNKSHLRLPLLFLGAISSIIQAPGGGLPSPVAETTPDTLRAQGANLTGAIGTKLKNVAKGVVSMPTYVELRDFINGQPVVNEAIVVANPVLYNVNTLKFIEVLPVAPQPEATKGTDALATATDAGFDLAVADVFRERGQSQ